MKTADNPKNATTEFFGLGFLRKEPYHSIRGEAKAIQ